MICDKKYPFLGYIGIENLVKKLICEFSVDKIHDTHWIETWLCMWSIITVICKRDSLHLAECLLLSIFWKWRNIFDGKKTAQMPRIKSEWSKYDREKNKNKSLGWKSWRIIFLSILCRVQDSQLIILEIPASLKRTVFKTAK